MKRTVLLLAVAVALLGTPAAVAKDGSQTVAYLGCSITMDAVNGYTALGGDDLWQPTLEISNGSPERWRDPTSRHWAVFDAALALHRPPSAVWYEVCPQWRNPSLNVGTLEGWLRQSIALLRLRIDAPVYMSAPPDLDTGVRPRCRAERDQPRELWQQVIAPLLAAGTVLPGPDMPALFSSEKRDGCHGNSAGQAKWGQVLVAFFGT